MSNRQGNCGLRIFNNDDGEKVFARIEQLDSKPPVVRYQFDNHLGSASLELDSVAAIISYEEYHPFGSTSYRSGKTETEVSLKRYKYASTGSAQCNGKERDDETGLYYYGARYYAAWLGRFVSVDPLAHQTPSWNPYHYCHNNPVNLVDPSGMCAKGPDDTSKGANPDDEFTKGGDYILKRDGSLTRVKGSQTERTRIVKRKARYDDDGNLQNKDVLDLGEVEITELQHGSLSFKDGRPSIPLQTFIMNAGEASSKLYKYIEDYISVEMTYVELEKHNGEKKAYFFTNHKNKSVQGAAEYITAIHKEGELKELNEFTHNHPNNAKEGYVGKTTPSVDDKDQFNYLTKMLGINDKKSAAESVFFIQKHGEKYPYLKKK